MKSTFNVLFFVKKDKQKSMAVTLFSSASQWMVWQAVLILKWTFNPKYGMARQAKPPDVLRKLPVSTDCWMI